MRHKNPILIDEDISFSSGLSMDFCNLRTCSMTHLRVRIHQMLLLLKFHPCFMRRNVNKFIHSASRSLFIEDYHI